MVVGDGIIVVEHVTVGTATTATTTSTARAGIATTCTLTRGAARVVAVATGAAAVVVDVVQARGRCRLTGGAQSPHTIAAGLLASSRRRCGNSRTLLGVLVVA